MSFAKLAALNHELHRISNIDRDTFFGRLEILEYYCEKTHKEGWRKFGRYGNIVHPIAFIEALNLLKNEAQFTLEEIKELQRWIKGQGESYGSPDQLVANVIMEFEIPKIWA